MDVIIKDYLLDNENGWNTEVETYEELFNGVDTTSAETVMQSLCKVEIALTDELYERFKKHDKSFDPNLQDYNVFAVADDNIYDDSLYRLRLDIQDKASGISKEVFLVLNYEESYEVYKAIHKEIETARKEYLKLTDHDLTNENFKS